MTSLQVAVLAINLLCALFIFADLCVTLFKTDIFTHANQEKIILNCQTDCKQLIAAIEKHRQAHFSYTTSFVVAYESMSSHHF